MHELRAGGLLDRARADQPGGFRAFLYGAVRNVALRAEARRARQLAPEPADLLELRPAEPLYASPDVGRCQVAVCQLLLECRVNPAMKQQSPATPQCLPGRERCGSPPGGMSDEQQGRGELRTVPEAEFVRRSNLEQGLSVDNVTTPVRNLQAQPRDVTVAFDYPPQQARRQRRLPMYSRR